MLDQTELNMSKAPRFPNKKYRSIILEPTNDENMLKSEMCFQDPQGP